MRQDLFNLRVEINETRAILNTIQRQLNRMEGKEVIFSDWEDDADYLYWRAGIDPSSDYEMLLGYHRDYLRDLNEKRDQAARLRLELPLTPCGVIAALIRAKRIQARQRKRNNRRKRRFTRR